MDNTDGDNKNTFIPANFTAISVWIGAVILVVFGGLGWYIFSLKAPVAEPTIGKGEIREVVGGTEFVSTPAGIFSYTIPGVPYVGIFNHVGEKSYINSDADGAVASMLEYWGEKKIDFAGILPELRKQSSNFFIQIPHIKAYIDSLDHYVTKVEQLTIPELKKYINSEIKTPLLFLLPSVQISSTDDLLRQASVMIGVNESKQKLIFHGYWSGNNTEIDFSYFETLQKQLPQEKQNIYLVIQPKNLKNTLEKLKKNRDTGYPSRGIIMNESQTMLKNYGIGSGAFFVKLFIAAERYLEQVSNDPKFEEFMPPYFKVLTLFRLAETKLALGKEKEAIGHALRAVELNHNLDKPFKDFPGYEFHGNTPDSTTDRISYPHRVLGDVYMKLNEFEMAKEAYKNALEINSNNDNVQARLDILNKHFTLVTQNTVSDINTETFKKILVQNSPWNVSWKSNLDTSGTQKISFSFDSGNSAKLSGYVVSSETRKGDMNDIVLQDNCIDFIFSVSGTQYRYCLTKSGVLEGIYSGVDTKENFFLGSATAKPSGN